MTNRYLRINMFKGLIKLCNFLLLWGFLYVGSFVIMIIFIVHIIKTNPTPIVHEHYSTVQVIEPPKRVLIEKEICTRLDGCPIVNGVCETCQIVKR